MAESSTGFTYRAFISYSHRDKTWADWLHKALETYRVPSRLVGTRTARGELPRRLNPIFRDRDELSSAPELGASIDAALAQSENLIVICSPASAASRWVNEEVLAYKRIGRATRIFCLIVAGEPDATEVPRRAPEECFCPALRFKLDANGRVTDRRTEPIAADARPGKDGKANAKLKLIAGMLDVGFDALKQREQQRRIRRMTAITAAAVSVMALTIVLAIFALVSRHHAVAAEARAEAARHAAVLARQAAQRRQKQAEDLVDFMLGNLSDKLYQESRLDIMQDVDTHAMEYFESLPPTDLNDTALAQRAKALEKIGNVRADVGNLPGALRSYRASARISSRLASDRPNDVARQVAYSRTLAYIGMTHWDQGRLGDAGQDFQAARHVLQPSLKRVPGNLPLLAQVTYLDDNLDHVLAAEGEPEEAERIARERLDLDEKLVKAKPTDTDYAADLGGAHNELGRLALQRGDLVAAITEYRADDTIETRLSEQRPADHNQRENMLSIRAILGRTLALDGDGGTGTRDLKQSVALASRLSRFDPQDTYVREQLGVYSAQLARLERESGDLRTAEALAEKAVATLTTLVKKDSSNGAWQTDRAGALIEQAEESAATRNPAAARVEARTALRVLEPSLAKHPDERRALLAVTTAKLLLASLANNPQDARLLREQSLSAMQAVKVDRADPRLLALQVKVLLALKRKSDARPLIKRLWNEGYRDAEFVALLEHERIGYPVNAAFERQLAESTQAKAPTTSASLLGDGN